MSPTLGILGLLFGLASASSISDGEVSTSSSLRGIVRDPDGRPAAGALVISTAGESTRSAADGSFELPFEREDGESLRVSAFARGPGGGTLLASTAVRNAAHADFGSVGDLTLSPSLTCETQWLPTFGEHPGTSRTVHALAVFDDGQGPALYVAGSIQRAGSHPQVDCIARWDGARWSMLATGVENTVRALAVFDDGNGPALYAAGEFLFADGLPAQRVARWDGSAWHALGSGLDQGAYALAVHDDGSGPALYAGGFFGDAGGTAAARIARWDGASWSAVGSGMSGVDSAVLALCSLDLGNGPELFAAGTFTSAGGASAKNVARWDGTAWAPLGTGTIGIVRTLTAFDDGNGLALYAGGDFGTAGAVSAAHVARWDGTDWSALGSGTDARVWSLAVHDAALHAAGEFTSAGGNPCALVARWDGTSWSNLGAGVHGTVGGNPLEARALASFDAGDGAELFVGGAFASAGEKLAHNVGSWDGADWHPLGSGIFGRNASSDSVQVVKALAVYDDGNGPALYVAGTFTHIGELTVNRIARWDGASWSDLDGGIDGEDVRALAVFDDGNGSALYAGGWFFTAGGVPAQFIARWDGASWSALPGPLESVVNALTVFDDGNGAALYAGGLFTLAGGVGMNRVGRFDGSSWSPLGSGTNAIVESLAVFDDGAGDALYVGGQFGIAGGVLATRIAKWDGAAWSALGSGLNAPAACLVGFDDGSGPKLYAGGSFTTAGGQPASRIARWNGASWSALGSGANLDVVSMIPYYAGARPALFVGGTFTSVGGLPASFVASWSGSSWSVPPGGISGAVSALCTYDSGEGPELFLGGYFVESPAGSSYLAVLAPCSNEIGTPFCFGDAERCPCGNDGGVDRGCANSTGGGARIAASGSASAAADDMLVVAGYMPAGQPALLFGALNAINGGQGIPFGDGLRCAGGGVVRLGVETPDAQGSALWGPGLASTAGYQAGDTRRFQAWYRDNAASPCGARFNYTHGLEVGFH